MGRERGSEFFLCFTKNGYQSVLHVRLSTALFTFLSGSSSCLAFHCWFFVIKHWQKVLFESLFDLMNPDFLFFFSQ